MFDVKYGITGVGTREPLKVVSLLKRYDYDGVEWSLNVRDYCADKKMAKEVKKSL